MLLLFLLCSLACSQPQLPPNAEPAPKTDRTEAAHQKESSPGHKQPSEKSAATMVNDEAKADPAKNSTESKADEELKINRSLSEYTGQLATFTMLLVVVGALQLLALGWQGYSLRHHSKLLTDSVTQMKSTVATYQDFVRTGEGMLALTRESNDNTREATELTRQSLKVAAESASAAASTAETAKNTLQMAHRPWVTAQGIDLARPLEYPPQNRFHLQVNVILKNTGTSVTISGLAMAFAKPDDSRVLSTEIREIYESTKQMQTTKEKSTPWETGFVLGPGSTLTMPMSMGADNISRDQVVQGRFYIIGCILYRDQFNISHRTQFCFQPEGAINNSSDFRFRPAPWMWEAD
jgi:hypothetical protein